MFDGEFERWQYGPVLPEIYHEFKRFRSSRIDEHGLNLWNEIIDYNDPLHESIISFLDDIIEAYGCYTGTQLSWMTHQPETAWYNGSIGTLIKINEMIDGKV